MIPHAIERGDGKPLILLHGVGGGASSWVEQIESLSRGRRVVAWDMPGYGRSAPITPMTWPGLAAALRDLLDHLRIDRATVLGHSMGGMVAQEFAATWPERLSGLILSGTSPAFGQAGGDWQKAFLAARLKPLDEGKRPADFAAQVVQAMLGDDPDPEGVRKAVASMSAIEPETYRAAVTLLVSFDRRGALGAIRVPTLVLSASKDPNAPPKVMQGMAKRIPGAAFASIPGAGHLAYLERPAAFDRAVLAFLDANAL